MITNILYLFVQKFVCTLIIVFISGLLPFSNIHAQQFSITPDTVLCKGNSIKLKANIIGAINTTHYAIQSSTFHWDTLSNYTTLDTMKDDDVRGPFNIGFTFSFLCNNYTQFYISSNGWISFGIPNDNSWVVKPIPGTGVGIPRNAILGPWEDWDPAIGGTINYGMSGTAPYRKMIIDYINVPMYACQSLTGTFQIVINETSNIIDNNIINKPSNPGCNSLTGINATQGLHNLTGDKAFVSPGRNATLWSASYETVKFIPDIDSSYIVWSNFDNLNGILHKWFGPSVVVKPDSSTFYIATLYKCDGSNSNARVNVTVIPGMLSSLSNLDTTICKGQSVLLRASATGGKAWSYHYYWLHDSTITTTGNFNTKPDSSLKYVMVVDDYCSVPDTHSVNINVRPPLKISGLTDTTLCFGTSIDIKPKMSGGFDSTRVLNWGSFTGNSKIFEPVGDTLIRIILSDNCTVSPDTQTVRLHLRNPLSVTTNADTTICHGDTLSLFTITSGGDTSNYKYNWNAGIPGVAKFDFPPDSSSTYIVKLSDGCTPKPAFDSVYIRVRRAPKIGMRTDSTICKGQEIKLFALPVQGDTDGVGFLWDHGIGLQNYYIVIPDSNTRYKVNLKDRCLKSPEEDSVNIFVRPSLSISLNDTLICYGSLLNLVPLATGGFAPNYKFTWNTGYKGDTLRVSPIQKTTYRVLLSDNCTKLPDSTFAIVDVLPPLIVTLPPDTLICSGNYLNITANASGGLRNYNYIWNSVSTNNPVYGIKALNDNFIYIEVTDGCSSPAFDTIRISTQPLPIPVFNSNEISNCTESKVQFYNKSSYAGNSIFTWDFGDGTFSNDSDVVHHFSTAGTYKVKLFISSPIGCTDSVSKTVTTTIRQGAKANFTASSFDVSVIDARVAFQTLSGDSVKHTWIFGNTGIRSSEFYPVITFPDTGNYLVTLIVQNLSGCTDTTGKYVRVTDVFEMFVPNSFTPNGDGKNDIFKPVTRGLKTFRLSIIDRGGNVVYETEDAKKGWDGKINNGSEIPTQEVFFYRIQTTDITDQAHEYNGTVTLVR
ncbi:MAG: PKD domain-containing protein [Bacteroidia bacterium]